MASVSRQIVRLVAVGATVPIIGVGLGYRMRHQQLSAISTTENRHYKVRDLPLYPTSREEERVEEPFPRNAVEAKISSTRKAVVQYFSQYQGSYENLKSKAQTSIDHSKGTLDYIQNNPGELPRVIFIAVAGMGGVVLGYRGGAFKKVTYGTIAGLSCAALCYPKKTVELSGRVSDYTRQLWKESGVESKLSQYWPSDKKEEEATKASVKLPAPPKKLKFLATEVSNTSPEAPLDLVKQVEGDIGQAKKQLEGDIGQSNPEDKDLYSTRTS